jgi:hypothetical protein
MGDDQRSDGSTTDLEALAEESAAQEEGDRSLVVVRMEEDASEDVETEGRPDVEQPGKLLRIASMVQRLLAEVRDIEDLDEASRRRLVTIYNRAIEQLHQVVSEDLSEELRGVVSQQLEGDGPPSKAELQIAKAQLVGWLEGLFHGIQATIASQQLAAQEQLARLRRQQELERSKMPDRPSPGQYL